MASRSCRVIVDTSLCKGCAICVEMCPANALKMSEKPGPRGYHNPVQVGECRGCRICEKFCPDFAIAIACEDSEQ